jgi:RNA polymerase sigma-70 factor (ECF subfamily)
MPDSAAKADGLRNRLRGRDPEALAELFSEHRDRLWRMASFRMDRRLIGRIDPEDVLQETYLAAAARLEHYDADASSSPFVWLRMVLMQTLTDLHRHHLGTQMRNAYREVALPGCHYPQMTSASLAAQLVGHFTSPSQAAAYEEMLAKVEQAVGAMDPLDQEVLALRHFEELSNSETAEVLGIQQSTASMRYVRAIKRLRETLSNMPGFEGYADA